MEDLHTVAGALNDAGVPVTRTELVLEAGTTIKVGEDDARALLRLIEFLDDLDDVSNVAANFDIDDETLAKLEG